MPEDELRRWFERVIELIQRLLSNASKPVYNLKEAAARLGYGDWYTRKLCNSGELKATKINGGAGGRGEWRIAEDAILEYEATHPRAGRRKK